MNKKVNAARRAATPLLAAMALLAAAFVLGGCSGGGKGTEEKHLIVAANPDHKTFDPALAYEPFSEWILASCYNNLMEYDGGIDKLVTGAASGYDVTPDGTVYTFSLRRDITFSTGNPLTSRDVKWSHERMINLRGSGSFMAEGIVAIETPDDYTVVYRLAESDPAFPYKLTFVVFNIIDATEAETRGAVSGPDAGTADTAKLWFDTHSAGSGPYQIVTHTPNVEVVLERNPRYGGARPHFDRVTLKSVPDPNTQAMMLQRGDVDVAFDIGPEQAKQLAGVAGVTIMDARSLTASFLLMNRSPAVGGPAAHPLVQKAIRLALDYPGIQTIAGPRMVTPRAPFPIGLSGSLGEADISGYPRTAEARALMAEAGHAAGFSTKLYVPTNKVLGVDLVLMAQKIQNDLKAINIAVELVPEEVTISLDTYRTGKQSLGLWYWQPDYYENTSQLAFLPGNVVGLRANWTEAMNPALAALGRRAATEVDNEKRNALYAEIQARLIEDTPYAMLLQHASQYAVRTGLTGVDYNMQRLDFKRIAE
ncbi:MAG: ABC transporter substrate-binding protein [Spirochaetaceae bacterium]|jgi:peptide/nickel transport system substrate-binding protein|nr:ABC transporter substrate-binding protein [Spirochaetaceae bacterium]